MIARSPRAARTAGRTGWSYARGSLLQSGFVPKHARPQISPARRESRFPAGQRGRCALTRAKHIGMEGLLRLRQVRQKKAEVHTGSPGVEKDAFVRKASRPGSAHSAPSQRSIAHARLTSARFPQCNSKGSGITDNCHCQTSELLIVTAAVPGALHEAPGQHMCRSARRADVAKRANRAVSAHRSCGRTARCRPTAALEMLKARCGVGRRYSRVHEDLLLDAHHLPGWQDGG